MLHDHVMTSPLRQDSAWFRNCSVQAIILAYFKLRVNLLVACMSELKT